MTLRLTALLTTAALALPAAAGAHPRLQHHGERGTFPHASRLCTKVANGHTPKQLASSEDQLKAACATLKSSYDAAVAAVKPAIATYRQTVKDERAAVKTACKGTTDKAACKAARQDARAKVKAARTTVRDAVKAYRTSIKSARKAFWTTVKGLRGGSTVTPDADTTPAAPAGAPAAS